MQHLNPRRIAKFCDAVDRLIDEDPDNLEAIHTYRAPISTGGHSPTGIEYMLDLLFSPDIDEDTRQRVQATLDRLPRAAPPPG
jgi:hypothetical protein